MIGWTYSLSAAGVLACWFECDGRFARLAAAPRMSSEADVGARPLRVQGGFRPLTCQRWGDVRALKRVARAAATQHYFARCAKRAIRERVPTLPLRSEEKPALEVVYRRSPPFLAGSGWDRSFHEVCDGSASQPAQRPPTHL